MLPALAEEVDSDAQAIALLECGPEWHAERKRDGVRCIITIVDGELRALNKTGKPMEVPAPVAKSFESFSGDWVFDAELEGKTLWIFDLVQAPHGHVAPEHPYSYRRAVLERLWDKMPINTRAVRLVESETEPEAKLKLAQKLREADAEGMMLKKANAPYHAGKRLRTHLKWKFWRTVDCFVMEKYREGKNSMSVGVLSPYGEVIDIGSVAMTPKDMDKLNERDVVELRYLYAADPAKPRLYQANFMRARTDKDQTDCLLTQLKYKG